MHASKGICANLSSRASSTQEYGSPWPTASGSNHPWARTQTHTTFFFCCVSHAHTRVQCMSRLSCTQARGSAPTRSSGASSTRAHGSLWPAASGSNVVDPHNCTRTHTHAPCRSFPSALSHTHTCTHVQLASRRSCTRARGSAPTRLSRVLSTQAHGSRWPTALGSNAARC